MVEDLPVHQAAVAAQTNATGTDATERKDDLAELFTGINHNKYLI